MQLREVQHELQAMGAQVVGVAEREDYQAKKLMDDGMPFALLLDPENTVRQLVGSSDRLNPLRLLDPRGMISYAKSWKRGGKFFAVTPSQATQHPGVVVVNAQGEITWSYIGQRLGDYPPLTQTMDQLEKAAT